jgi:hypothetical protein
VTHNAAHAERGTRIVQLHDGWLTKEG